MDAEKDINSIILINVFYNSIGVGRPKCVIVIYHLQNGYNSVKSNQIKSNHFYCQITTAHVPWLVKFLRVCSRQCRNNLHIDSTYLQTYTDDERGL